MDSHDNERIDSRLRDAYSSEFPDASALQIAVGRKIRYRRAKQILLIGAAAAVFFAFSGYVAVGHEHRQRVYTQLALDHHREVVNREPRHWRTQPSEIQILAAKFGLSDAVAQSIAPAGYRLEQARTCGMDGKPVLHLVYTNGSREISIYVRPRSNADLSGSAASNLEQIAIFRTRKFEAAVVINGTKSECLDIAHQTARIL
jgi:anti-sigma factor RsiW